MINRLRIIPTNIRVPEGNGDNVGFGVLAASDQIVVDFGRVKGRKYVVTTPASPVRLVTAAVTLTPAQVSGTVTFDTTTSTLVTLPLAASCKGCRIRATWKQITAAGTGHGFNPQAVDGIGLGVHPTLTAVVNKEIYSASGTDAVTDRLELTSDGVNTWLITDYVGAFTKEA